jgi:ABC-2 type transport system permease protein
VGEQPGMTGKRIKNILLKEWEVIFRDLNNLMFVTIIPLLIIAEPLVIMWLVSHFGGESITSSSIIQNAMEKLQAEIPQAATLATAQQFQVLLLSQFKFFLLLIPTMIAISFATFTILEEKQSRSLEPLLATPVRTWELLLGKALSGAIPALVVSWICAIIFFLGVAIMGWGSLISLVLTPSWFLVFFVLTPAIAVLSFLLGVIGSSQAKDAKNAQNLVVAVILPVFALIAVQVTGLVWFTPWLTLALSLGLIIVDYLVLRVAVSLFQRESIVIKWH